MNPAPTFTVRTFGCKVNQYDSQLLAERLHALGLRFVDDRSSPAGVQAGGADEAVGPRAVGASDPVDLVVVNSCAVTVRSEAKARRLVRWLLRRYPRATVVLTGCAVRLDARPWEAIGRDRARPDEAGRGTGPPRLFLVPSPEEVPGRLVEAGLVATGAPSGGPLPARAASAHTRISGFLGHDRAFVKVQDGCQAFCSYCVVPLVRPVLWSRPADEVVGEVRALSEAGYGEVVLVGVHLGLYGADGAEEPRGSGRPAPLVALIRRLLAETDVGRLRLSSIEPQEVTDDLIDLAAESDRLCPHFHLPLQSGDDGVLRAMNRRYTAREYLGILKAIAERIPRPAFTTDILLGFPGEGEAEFAKTLSVVREARFSRIHAFRYSPRPGTKAATLPGRAPEREVLRREHALLALAAELARCYRTQFLGEVVEVLVEGSAGLLASPPLPQPRPGGAPTGRAGARFQRARVRDAGPPAGCPGMVGAESKTQEFLAGLSERYLRVRFPRPSANSGRAERAEARAEGVPVKPGSLVRVRVLSSDDSGLVGEWEPKMGRAGKLQCKDAEAQG